MDDKYPMDDKYTQRAKERMFIRGCVERNKTVDLTGRNYEARIWNAAMDKVLDILALSADMDTIEQAFAAIGAGDAGSVK